MTYKNTNGHEFTIDGEGYLLNQYFDIDIAEDDFFQSNKCTTDCDVIGMTDDFPEKFKFINPELIDKHFLEKILLNDVNVTCDGDCHFKIKVL